MLTIDLFAGIGGIRLAFEQNGCINVFSSEIDKFAKQTYEANFKTTPFGDITKIETKDIPDHDILLAGFPCQPFSQAGKKLGFEDTRGTLFFEISRILQDKKPKMFLLENVKNLQSHDGGKTLSLIIKILKELGYYVPLPEILNAKDFGVPQNRERIFIVGFLKDSLKQIPPFYFPKKTLEKTSLKKILEKNVPNKYTLSDKLWEGHLRRKENHKKKGNGFGFSLFEEDSVYVNTITARYYKDGSEVLIKQKNKNPRKLTPRECARLQGFPDSYVIPVSDTQSYKQFGNSVCVVVIDEIAKNMLNYYKINAY